MNQNNERKKELMREYKERKITGGVYKISNTANGKYCLDTSMNLAGMRNRFEFSRDTGTSTIGKMAEDWSTFGAKAFLFEIMEEIEKKENQTMEEYKEDLQFLLSIWAERFDPAMRY